MIKIFTLVSNEVIISEFETHDGYLLLKYPAVMMPMEQGRLGFMKHQPFSDPDQKITLFRDKIVTESFPIKQLGEAYENWVVQVKANDAGITVTSNMPQNNI